MNIKVKKPVQLLMILDISIFLLISLMHTRYCYADSYTTYSGTSSHSTDISAYTQSSGSGAYFRYSSATDKTYVPNNLPFGRVEIYLDISSLNKSSYWSYANNIRLSFNAVANDGSEVFITNMTFTPTDYMSGGTVYVGEYYLGQNYKGIRVTSVDLISSY